MDDLQRLFHFLLFPVGIGAFIEQFSQPVQLRASNRCFWAFDITERRHGIVGAVALRMTRDHDHEAYPIRVPIAREIGRTRLAAAVALVAMAGTAPVLKSTVALGERRL